MTQLDLLHTHRDLLAQLHTYLASHGAEGWLVGGYVRDLLIGRPSTDIDVAVDGDALALARGFADATGGAWVPMDEDTGTARIVWRKPSAGEPQVLDLVRLRAPTIEADLRARDFTINALALPLEAVVAQSDVAPIDPLGGLADLGRRVVRSCSDHAILDDPLRMLRAARIAGGLGFEIVPELKEALLQHHLLIDAVSAERVRDELLKLLALPNAGHWLAFLDEVRLLTAIIPELEPARDCDQPGLLHYLDVLDHLLEAVVAADWLVAQLGGDEPEEAIAPDALWAFPDLRADLPYADRVRARLDEMVDGVPRRALFKLAVLLHDVAKPQTKAFKPDGGISFYDHDTIGAQIALAIARRLRLSRNAADYVRLIVREHMRPGQLNALGEALTMRAVYRFFRATGDAGPDVLLHSLCDHLAMQGPRLSLAGWAWHVRWTGEMLQVFYDQEAVSRPQPILRGDDLIRELGIKPGPEIGRLLERVREAQAAGEVRTREAALEWVRQARTQVSTGEK